MLLDVSFSMFYTLEFSSKILVFPLVSMISTSMVFIDWIILGKLIVPIENNHGFVAKMIFFSSMIPLW